jgi:hypothetical protein
MDAYADRREGEALTHRQTLLIVLGVLLPTFMGALTRPFWRPRCPRSDAPSAMCTTCRG